jgi:hypothetical protein
MDLALDGAALADIECSSFIDWTTKRVPLSTTPRRHSRQNMKDDWGCALIPSTAM